MCCNANYFFGYSSTHIRNFLTLPNSRVPKGSSGFESPHIHPNEKKYYRKLTTNATIHMPYLFCLINSVHYSILEDTKLFLNMHSRCYKHLPRQLVLQEHTKFDVEHSLEGKTFALEWYGELICFIATVQLSSFPEVAILYHNYLILNSRKLRGCRVSMLKNLLFSKNTQVTLLWLL